MPQFYMIFARQNTFPKILEKFPAQKLRVSGLDPNTNYVINYVSTVDITG